MLRSGSGCCNIPLQHSPNPASRVAGWGAVPEAIDLLRSINCLVCRSVNSSIVCCVNHVAASACAAAASGCLRGATLTCCSQLILWQACSATPAAQHVCVSAWLLPLSCAVSGDVEACCGHGFLQYVFGVMCCEFTMCCHMHGLGAHAWSECTIWHNGYGKLCVARWEWQASGCLASLKPSSCCRAQTFNCGRDTRACSCAVDVRFFALPTSSGLYSRFLLRGMGWYGTAEVAKLLPEVCPGNNRGEPASQR